MKRHAFSVPAIAAALGAFAFCVGGDGFAQEPSGPAPGTVVLWDTGKHSDEALASDALVKRDGWKEVAEGAGLSGDACLANTLLTVVFRKGNRGAEAYYRLGDKFVKGAEVSPVGAGGDKCRGIESVKAFEQYKDKIALEVAYATESGKKVSALHILQKDRPILETRPGAGVERISVEKIRGKYAVLPDFFGGDVVVSAERTAAPAVNFPSDHMVVQLADDGDAIVMCVFRSGEQKVKMALEGADGARLFSAMDVECSKDKAHEVCTAILAAPKIWHRRKIGELDKVKGTKLDWQVPFRAQWRVAMRRNEDDLVDSWGVAWKGQDGKWQAPGCGGLQGDRTTWSSTRGTFPYPAWMDEADAVFLKSWKFENHLKNVGHETAVSLTYKADDYAVVYPFEAGPKTAPGTWTVLDVLKNGLEGVPEQYVWSKLRPERLPQDKFWATCAVTEEYEKIFDAKEEKQKRKHMLERLRNMYFFVLTIRERAESYRDWLTRMQEFYTQQKAARPGASGLIAEIEKHSLRIQKVYDATLPRMQQPPAALGLVDGAIGLIDGTQPNKDELSKDLGKKTRMIGGAQDGTMGSFRKIVKELRQKAGYRMVEAKDADSLEFAREVRRRTMEMLSGYFGHEGLD